ncbi:hypothetical protein HDU76_011273, partial [Blyttiomyces sp. JEL0837]
MAPVIDLAIQAGVRAVELAPRQISSPAGWVNIGCYGDTGSPRTFSAILNGYGRWDVETCLAAALQQGFNLAAVEFGGECWADNTWRNSSSMDVPQSACTYPCSANPSELCGGPNLMN